MKYDQQKLNRLAKCYREIIATLYPEYEKDPNFDRTDVRAAKAWLDWTAGYDKDGYWYDKTFQVRTDGMVVVTGIPVWSKCAHHLADITGVAHVGYIPDKDVGVLGLSKIARIVDLYSRRLTTQEEITDNVAQTVYSNATAQGAGAIVIATHACMNSRGILAHGSKTVTSAMRGAMINDATARNEFLKIIELGQK